MPSFCAHSLDRANRSEFGERRSLLTAIAGAVHVSDMWFLAAISLILFDPAGRPDLEALAITIDIALEDADSCESELRLGEADGPRCDVFLLGYREALIGRLEVNEWTAAGMPAAEAGDAELVAQSAASIEILRGRGDRILRRIEILTAD